MLHICARWSYNFAQAKKYLIVKSNYLIEAPPKRPVSGFLAYSAQQRKGIKQAVSKSSSVVGEAWKALSSEHKSVYEQKFKESRDAYNIQKSQYVEKFVTPFKRATTNGLFIARLYKDKVLSGGKGIKVTQLAKQVGQKVKQATKQQMQSLKKESEQINEKRKVLADQFKFPERLYHSQTAFSRANSNIDVKQRAKAYKLYVEHWYKDVAKWIKKNNLDLDIATFKRMYNRSLKEKANKKNKESEELVEKSKQELDINQETKEVASASKK